jgi:hypothetical protein
VKVALKHAEESLNPGGVILVRDGIYTDHYKQVSIRFEDNDGLQFFKNYVRDFKGLPLLLHKKIEINGSVVKADINYMREFLYTYTWGADSYACEVQEQFGYMTESKWERTFEQLEMKVEYSRVLTEPGYPEHLNDKVELIDFAWDDIPSTCIFVARKNG